MLPLKMGEGASVYHCLRYPKAPSLVPSRTLRVAFVLVLTWLAARPAGAAPESISRVREIARTAEGTPVAVRGVVTRYRAGRSIAIQDDSASIFAYTEATGVADLDEQRSPSIAGATYRKVGATDPPQSITVSAAELARGRHEADLVSVEGSVVRVETGRYE